MPGDTGGRGGGFLGGLSTLVEKLSELAEKGERLQKSGELGGPDDKARGSYSVEIRTLGGADREEAGPRVEPVKEAPEAREERVRPAVQPIREPLVDVFDEAGGLLVVAQVPGVACHEIVLELRGDVLAMHAEHDDLRYQKELLLPRSYSKERMHATCRNGVLEIRMTDTEGHER